MDYYVLTIDSPWTKGSLKGDLNIQRNRATLVGPFLAIDDAHVFGQEHLADPRWHVVELEAPFVDVALPDDFVVPERPEARDPLLPTRWNSDKTRHRLKHVIDAALSVVQTANKLERFGPRSASAKAQTSNLRRLRDFLRELSIAVARFRALTQTEDDEISYRAGVEAEAIKTAMTTEPEWASSPSVRYATGQDLNEDGGG